MSLKPQHELFCVEYLKDSNGTQAAIRAGYAPGSADKQAYRLLRNVHIRERIALAAGAAIARVEADVDDVLRHYLAAAFLDRNEIARIRRTCCRWCHGERHGYQRSKAERLSAYEKWHENPDRSPIDVFDEKGGEGWNPEVDPHPECPNCFGKGQVSTEVSDSTKLSAAAKMIYNGFKLTRYGVEAILSDRAHALDMLAAHLALLNGSGAPESGIVKEYIETTVAEIGTEDWEPAEANEEGPEAVPADGQPPEGLAKSSPRVPGGGPGRYGEDPGLPREAARSL